MSKQITVYILHGWAVDPQNEAKWQPVREQLEARGIKTTFLPIPGLTTPLEEVWGLEQYCEWLSGVLPFDESVILMGHSFGGQLATRFAARFPQRVARLILIDSSGLRDAGVPAKIKRAIFKALAAAGKQLTHSPLARQLLYALAREKDYYNAPPIMRQTMARVVADEVVQDFAHITIPTLILWGAQDKITPVKNVQLFAQIQNSQVHIFPTARHSPQFTHPAAVAEQVEAFVYG
jgi:pimeloyl-ACP methyl ester carboxylesterase